MAISASEIEHQQSVNFTPTDPRYPVPNPSLSYWLQNVRSSPLLDHRSTEELPETADVVVIGSGLSGSLIAYSLLHSENPPKSIVILEARELCSGATGRNAGHCKPDQYRGFSKYAARHGPEQAIKILQNEQQTFLDLVAFVKANNVDCDLWTGDTLDVAMSPDVLKTSLDNWNAFKLAGGNTSGVEMILDKEKAVELSRLKDAQAVWRWTAGSLYPHKLVQFIIKKSIEKGLNLQTHTPALSVTAEGSQWKVETSRGSIVATTIVHAQNAFVSTHLEQLKDCVKPVPFVCNKVVPPPSFSGSKSLNSTYGVILDGGNMFSINPRSNSDGIVLFGGNNPGQHHLDTLLEKHPELKTDDRIGNFKPISDAVATFAEEQFIGWGKFKDMSVGSGLDYSWSGVLGMSADGLPWIGRVPGLPGQFVCAGFSGHGMARIFTSAPAVASLVLNPNKTFAETGLPEVFEMTEERCNKGWQGGMKAGGGIVKQDVKSH